MSSKNKHTAMKLPPSLITLFALLMFTIIAISYWSYQSTTDVLSFQSQIINSQGADDKSVKTERATLISAIEQVHKTQLITFVFLIVLVAFTFIIVLQRLNSTLRLQQKAILQQANYDLVTGLPNRTLFWEYLKLAIAHANRNKKLVAIVRLNINRFNQINTGLGHQIADKLLLQVAQRLTKSIRACDTVARMGGDDFAIIISELDGKDEIEAIMHRVLDPIKENFSIESHMLNISTSAGIAVYPIDQNEANSLLLSADSAMAESKNDKAGDYVFFTSEMGLNSTTRLHEEQSLRQALENNEYRLHYQPKVDSSMGKVKGFEALIRWQHPERGLVPPISFVPILEESGLIIPVGEWVIRETCEAIRRWMKLGLDIVPVSVNVSAPQFNQKDFVQRVKDILDETKVDAKYIEIEITESCLMSDASANIEIVKALKALGMSVAVDDFGTGYSSLNHLNRFPIDTLKIDRSFITNVNKRHENDNAGIVTAIMSLSTSLRLNVVAEGVETAQELMFLYALGCRTIQGFLFSKPLVEDDVINLLQDSQSIDDALEAARQELSA